MNGATALQVTGFGRAATVGHALSLEARRLGHLMDDASRFSRSVALDEPRIAAEHALRDAFCAAQEKGWSEEGNIPVEASTFSFANLLLRRLPTTAVPSEIVPDSDGEILLIWDRGPRSVLSVSIGRDGTVSFAALFGHRKFYGMEYLGESLPSGLSTLLESFAQPGR